MAGLKLRAADAEDLAVISAILQDSLVTVGEMTYLPDESRFVLVANRFRWEPQSGPVPAKGERVLTGLCIDGVKAVSRRGFSPRDGDRILSLAGVAHGRRECAGIGHPRFCRRQLGAAGSRADHVPSR